MSLFETMGLKAEILGAIQELGFENPTPIQEKTIPFLLETDQDMVALAQTGTGKTAAFGLPIVQQFDSSVKVPQALILSPTRELALQIAKDLENFSKNINGVKIATLYGGSDIRKQIKELE
ncbi:MAG TPA: DEAD/DEAH box helicase, partial [Draconibacterium sp.]|nr:DEAD/DEAH box helicase [Draconibacterium sp.]